MVMSACGSCKESVANRQRAVACERCMAWFHVACVGMKEANMKALGFELLVFLCRECLSKSLNEWRNQDEEKEERVEQSTQTENLMKEAEAQTTKTEERKDQQEVVEVARTDRRPRKKRMVVKKAPVRVIGDSMVRKTPDFVRREIECTSMGGAKIQDIKRKVKEEVQEMEERSLLVVQGGGNNLVEAGAEDTVKEVIEAVRAAEEKMCVAVGGVLRRPREGVQYEKVRRETNRKICMELMKIKMEWMAEKKGNVSFLDMDGILDQDKFFGRDGVHLNHNGNERLGRRLAEWMRARQVCCVDEAW